MFRRESNADDREALHLSKAQLSELIDRLELLYQARSMGGLMVAAITLIQPFFDADTYSIGFTDPKRRRHLAIMRPTNPGFLHCGERYRELAARSPRLQYWLRTGDHDRVLRRSDCCDPSWYRNTAMYSDIDRLTGADHLIGTWIRPGGGRHLEVAMGRGGRVDFSRREIARLTALRRHIHRAYLYVCDLQRLSAMVSAKQDEDLPADVCELQDTSLSARLDDPAAPAKEDPLLTPREREVLHWITEGKTNQEIGVILAISWRTVRLHCERIFHKLNVETRTAAAMRAVEFGFNR